MNIKDFLIDNYIWILVIILITIITIIGFLADKKRTGKNNKENNNSMNNQPMPNSNPIQYQQPMPEQTNQMNSNMGMNYNMNNNFQTQIQPQTQNITNNQIPNNNINNTINQAITQPQPVQFGPTISEPINIPQAVENIIPNISQESMYQPLSEQTPVIPPQPVPDFSSAQGQVNMENIQEQPQLINPNLNVNNNMIPTPLNIQTPEAMYNQTLNANYQVPQVENNNFGIVQNYQPNNTTIPQPITNPTPIPTPQPVNPQTIMPGTYNQPQPIQNYNQPVQGQPVQSTPQPINFIYGSQNNNQNM